MDNNTKWPQYWFLYLLYAAVWILNVSQMSPFWRVGSPACGAIERWGNLLEVEPSGRKLDHCRGMCFGRGYWDPNPFLSLSPSFDCHEVSSVFCYRLLPWCSASPTPSKEQGQVTMDHLWNHEPSKPFLPRSWLSQAFRQWQKTD
jgi:hypothetical protein